MIALRRLDGTEFVLNALLIETVEATPDTIVTLTTGRKYVVREPVAEVVQAVIAFHRSIRCNHSLYRFRPVRPRTGGEGQ
ncbi:MAG: flagellar FlbD family protein [Firmicutes bacterium]|nr:flagellar FlbD family protein [Bacillota bacterium]